MPIVIVFTSVAALAGGVGYFADIRWLFWVGAGLSALNLFMNLASGAMKFPILPLLCMSIGATISKEWFFGACVGLVVWTIFESGGEIFSILFLRRRAG